MFAHTDIKQAPWYVVASDVKKHARINHLLSLIPYEEMKAKSIHLEERPTQEGYVRPPMDDQTFMPEVHHDMLK